MHRESAQSTVEASSATWKTMDNAVSLRSGRRLVQSVAAVARMQAS